MEKMEAYDYIVFELDSLVPYSHLFYSKMFDLILEYFPFKNERQSVAMKKKTYEAAFLEKGCWYHRGLGIVVKTSGDYRVIEYKEGLKTVTDPAKIAEKFPGEKVFDQMESFNTDFSLPQLYFLCCLKEEADDEDWHSIRKQLTETMDKFVFKALEQSVQEAPFIFLMQRGCSGIKDLPPEKKIVFSHQHSRDYIKFVIDFLFNYANFLDIFTSYEECESLRQNKVLFISEELKHIQRFARWGWHGVYVAWNLETIKSYEVFYRTIKKRSKLQITNIYELF